MKQFFYVLRTLWRNKGTTIIKIVSLGLAIMMCSLLLTRIAFLQSFDTGFRDYKNLYQIWIKWGMTEDTPPQPRSLGDIQRLIAEAYPEEIEYATTLFNGTFVGRIYIGSDRHDINGWAADENVFPWRLLPFTILITNLFSKSKSEHEILTHICNPSYCR